MIPRQFTIYHVANGWVVQLIRRVGPPEHIDFYTAKDLRAVARVIEECSKEPKDD